MPFVKYELDNGGSVVVEVDFEDLYGSGEMVPATPGDTVRRAQRDFDEALSSVRALANSVISSVTELDIAPSEVSVVFGVKLTGSSSIVVAKGSAEANFQLTMTWKHDKHSEPS